MSPILFTSPGVNRKRKSDWDVGEKASSVIEWRKGEYSQSSKNSEKEAYFSGCSDSKKWTFVLTVCKILLWKRVNYIICPVTYSSRLTKFRHMTNHHARTTTPGPSVLEALTWWIFIGINFVNLDEYVTGQTGYILREKVVNSILEIL